MVCTTAWYLFRRYAPMLLWATFPLIGLAPRASGQLLPAPGSRIRFSTDSVSAVHWTQGRYIALDDVSLRLVAANGDTLKVPRPTIYQLEISERRRTHTIRGLVIGAAGGATAALLLRGAACAGGSQPSPDKFWKRVCCNDNGPMISMGIGAAVGIPLGGIIGRLGKTDEWVHVTLGRRP